MGAAPSCQDACESKDAPPQVIVAEQVVAEAPKQQKPPFDDHDGPHLEHQIEKFEKAPYVLPDGTQSKVRRSLLLEKKLITDTEIMRGIPLKHTLRKFGRIWRKSPLDMPEEEREKLWEVALPVEKFDVFLSHTWHTSGISKFISLSLQLTWAHILLCGLGFAVFFEFLFFMDFLPALGSPWLAEFQGYSGIVPFSLWAVVAEYASLVPFLLASCLPSAPCFAFLDVASIHQVDEELKERGIYGLGGFLKASKELRILWSPPYLSRLWCVFEIAAYRISNPLGKIELRPLFVETTVVVCWLGMHIAVIVWLLSMVYLSELGNFTLWVALAPLVAMLHSLRKNFRQKQQLLDGIRDFDLAAVDCRVRFDKEFVHAAIVEWYGGIDAFTKYVRGPLREELASGQRCGVPISYCLILVAPFLSVGISTFVGLLKAGLPLHISASYFFAGVVGLWLCWVASMVQFVLFLCDRLARPLVPGFDILQTFFIFAVMAVTAFSGLMFGTRAYRHSLHLSCLFAAASVLILWLTNGGLTTLTKLRSGSPKRSAA